MGHLYQALENKVNREELDKAHRKSGSKRVSKKDVTASE